MHIKLIFYLSLFSINVSFFSCVDLTKEEIIKKNINLIGSWEDENSTVKYLEDGTFKGQWGTRAANGIWQIHKDTLKMKFIHGHEPYYIVKRYSNDTLVIKSILDGEMFTKIKVHED